MRRNNIFQVGGPVFGEGYIGRKSFKRDLLEGIFKDNQRHSGVIISGLTRMGKTSLVLGLFQNKKENENKGIYTAAVNVSSCENFKEFLFEIAEAVYDSLAESINDIELLNDVIGDYYKPFEDENISVRTADHALRQMFKKLYSKEKIKFVILLDEFDGAVKAFEKSSTNFQKFRDLASNTDYNVSFILVCRANMSRIETSLPTGSNLKNIFHEIKLTGFDSSEMDEYYNKIQQCGVSLTNEQKRSIEYYAGCSPYLLSAMAEGILNTPETVADEDINITDIYYKYEHDFVSYFDQLIRFMKDEHQYEFMKQLFIGPRKNIKDINIKELCLGGYIYKNNGGEFIDQLTGEKFTYTSISVHFIEYIRQSATINIDESIWKNLTDAEVSVRKIIREELKKKDGDQWEQKLKERALEKDFFKIGQAERFIENTEKNLHVSGNDVLNVISIMALRKIVDDYWATIFSNIFDPPYDKLVHLDDEMDKMHQVRNPYAHGTPEFVSDELKFQVDKCCANILEVYKNYEDKK